MGPARYTSCAMLLQERDASLYTYVCRHRAELVLVILTTALIATSLLVPNHPRWLHQRPL
jgi:hypothetical protein